MWSAVCDREMTGQTSQLEPNLDIVTPPLLSVRRKINMREVRELADVAATLAWTDINV